VEIVSLVQKVIAQPYVLPLLPPSLSLYACRTCVPTSIILSHLLYKTTLHISHIRPSQELFKKLRSPYKGEWIDGAGHNDIEHRYLGVYVQLLTDFAKYLNSHLSYADEVAAQEKSAAAAADAGTTSTGGLSSFSSSISRDA